MKTEEIKAHNKKAYKVLLLMYFSTLVLGIGFGQYIMNIIFKNFDSILSAGIFLFTVFARLIVAYQCSDFVDNNIYKK